MVEEGILRTAVGSTSKPPLSGYQQRNPRNHSRQKFIEGYLGFNEAKVSRKNQSQEGPTSSFKKGVRIVVDVRRRKDRYIVNEMKAYGEVYYKFSHLKDS